MLKHNKKTPLNKSLAPGFILCWLLPVCRVWSGALTGGIPFALWDVLHWPFGLECDALVVWTFWAILPIIGFTKYNDVTSVTWLKLFNILTPSPNT